VSYRQVARIVGCGKAAAQARIARFERLPERDAVLATVRNALARIPV
jgi:alkylated DNA nucleotide flippase Atl1